MQPASFGASSTAAMSVVIVRQARSAVETNDTLEGGPRRRGDGIDAIDGNPRQEGLEWRTRDVSLRRGRRP